MTQIILLTSLLAVWQNPTSVCTAPGNQENFLALSYADGGVLVLWEDYRNGDADIYTQALDADGNALWQENGIPVITEAGDQTQLDAVVLESGDAVVAWDDERVSGQHSVYAQCITPSGSLEWDAEGVPVRVYQLGLTEPHLCSSGDGALVEWKIGDDALKARRVLSNGDVVWPDSGITICTNWVGLGDITPDISAGMIISYWKTIWGNQEIIGEFRVQRLDSLGSFLWGDSGILIYTDTSSSLKCPSSQNVENRAMGTPDGSGGVILQWREPLWRAQRVDSTGNFLWGDSSIVVIPVHAGIVGNYSSLEDNGIYIVRGSPDAYPDEYVYFHRLTLEGEKPLGDTGVEVWRVWAGDPAKDVVPHVIENGIVVWRDSWDRGIGNDKYDEQGLLVQRVDTSGNTLWPEEVLICGTSVNDHLVVSSHDNSAIVTWSDTRNGNMNIYSAHVDSLGNVSAVVESKPKTESVFQLVSGIGYLNYLVPSQTELSVYSCSGQHLLEEIVSGEGMFNPLGLPSGVYFVQFQNKNLSTTTKLVVVK